MEVVAPLWGYVEFDLDGANHGPNLCFRCSCILSTVRVNTPGVDAC